MLSRGFQKNILKSIVSLQSNKIVGSLPVAIQYRNKTWASNEPEKLQKMTEQALIHDISLHQLETGNIFENFIQYFQLILISFSL